MATEIRYQNGVIIVEPHGKIVGNSVSELQTAILPEVKAFESTPHPHQPCACPSDELFRIRRPHASLGDYQT